MPSLIDLYNNLSTFNYYTGRGNFTQNKLPFGPDRANGGQSAEPYIKNPKYPTSITGIEDAIVHAATDVVRMTKFIKDAPKGPLFIAKQVGLQFSNPLIEHKNDFTTSRATNLQTKGQGFVGNTINFTKNTANAVANGANQIQNIVGSNRIFTPVNFLAQIAGSALGKHIPRQGFSLQVDPTDKYPYIVSQKDKNNKEDNRLVKYLKRFSSESSAPETAKLMVSYAGGPNSYLGLGNTSIYSYYSTFAAADTSNPDSVKTLNGFIPITQKELLNVDDSGYIFLQDGTYVNTADIDFRAYKAATNKAYAKQVQDKNIRISNYKTINTTTRIGVINTNNKSQPYNPNDSINMMSLYYSQFPAGNNAGGNVTDINGRVVTKEGIRDLIKFRLKALSNDKPGYGVYMIFRAFLNGAISDDMSVDLNRIRYVGRGENFYGYEGFTSGYSLSFTVCAFSKEEMKPLYQKLNYLKSCMAPDYKDNKMRGTFIELTVGDYIKYQPGFIENLRISIPEDANWEIAMLEPEGDDRDKDMHELPQTLRVEMSFIPVYNFLPRKSSEATFIGIDDSEADGVNGRPTRAQSFAQGGKEWIYGTDQKLK